MTPPFSKMDEALPISTDMRSDSEDMEASPAEGQAAERGTGKYAGYPNHSGWRVSVCLSSADSLSPAYLVISAADVVRRAVLFPADDGDVGRDVPAAIDEDPGHRRAGPALPLA